MSHLFQCPGCNNRFQVATASMGKSVACPHCKRPILLPIFVHSPPQVVQEISEVRSPQTKSLLPQSEESETSHQLELQDEQSWRRAATGLRIFFWSGLAFSLCTLVAGALLLFVFTPGAMARGQSPIFAAVIRPIQFGVWVLSAVGALVGMCLAALAPVAGGRFQAWLAVGCYVLCLASLSGSLVSSGNPANTNGVRLNSLGLTEAEMTYFIDLLIGGSAILSFSLWTLFQTRIAVFVERSSLATESRVLTMLWLVFNFFGPLTAAIVASFSQVRVNIPFGVSVLIDLGLFVWLISIVRRNYRVIGNALQTHLQEGAA